MHKKLRLFSYLFDVRNRLHSLSMSLLRLSIQAIDWMMDTQIKQSAKYYYKKMNIKLTDLRASRSSIVLDVFSNAYRNTTIHICEQLEGKYSGTSLIMAPLGLNSGSAVWIIWDVLIQRCIHVTNQWMVKGGRICMSIDLRPLVQNTKICFIGYRCVQMCGWGNYWFKKPLLLYDYACYIYRIERCPHFMGPVAG